MLLALGVALALAGRAHAAAIAFEPTLVDAAYGGTGGPGWVQAGDLDADCVPEIVAGGGGALYVYKRGPFGGWYRSVNLDSTHDMGCNGGVLHDVDRDGDLDVVAARYESDLGWWQNPGSLAGPWTFRVLASGLDGWFLHDLIVVDLDQDGEAREFIAVLHDGYWDAPGRVYWLRPRACPYATWSRFTITAYKSGAGNNHAGIDVGDIDRDGDLDVAFSNGWFASSGDPAGQWTWRQVTNIYGVSNTLLRDLNHDGRLDLVMSAGHHGQGVYWFQNAGNPPGSAWLQRNLSGTVGDITTRHHFGNETAAHVHHPEGLQVADLDDDGDLDVLVSELYFGEDPGEADWSDAAHSLYVYENLGGASPSWRRHTVATDSVPHHLPQLADVDRDAAASTPMSSNGVICLANVQVAENQSPVSPSLVLVMTESPTTAKPNGTSG